MTPRPVTTPLSKKIEKALREPDVQKHFADLGATLVGNTPDQFGTFIRAETKKWHGVVKAAGIKLQ